jgi:type IV pilus assembly protein PilQ
MDSTDTGEERLSISIQDADIQTVLKALSIKKKLNIVTGQDVSGKVSINLYDIPLKDALDAIITTNGYSYIRRDNILFVTKSGEDPEEDSLGKEVRTFKLKYADIDEVEKVITRFLSSSARITIYKPEKTLIVEDAPHNLDRVRKLLDSLDIPPKQVLIETRIMEVRLNDDTSLGIDWSDTFSGFFNSTGNIFTQGFTGASQGFFFNVVNGDFELFLDALQTKTEVNNLSSPRLLALDNKKANIIIGDKLGYNVTTATDGTVLQSVEFLDTGTQLVLTPHIIDDGRVIMDIHPEVSDGTVIAGLPQKTTTEVTTSLMAPDGGTIFIGGLIRNRNEDIVDRVPGLGAIPLFGALFSKTTNKSVRSEIIVLITPHIITPDTTGILEKDTERVKSKAEELKKERSLKELLPGT